MKFPRRQILTSGFARNPSNPTALSRKFAQWAAVAFFFASPAPGWAGILDELDETQRSLLETGSQVVVLEDIEGKPWPRVSVYSRVDASPPEVAAIFFDYASAKSFVPNLLKSEVSRQISPTTAEVDYGLKVPIFPDEFYTVRSEVRALKPEGYSIDWTLVRAVMTKHSMGSFRVEPHKEKAIFCYRNLVIPASNVAKLLRGSAIKQMKDTASAIESHVEKEKQENPAALKQKVGALRAVVE